MHARHPSQPRLWGCLAALTCRCLLLPALPLFLQASVSSERLASRSGLLAGRVLGWHRLAGVPGGAPALGRQPGSIPHADWHSPACAPRSISTPCTRTLPPTLQCPQPTPPPLQSSRPCSPSRPATRSSCAPTRAPPSAPPPPPGSCGTRPRRRAARRASSPG